MALGDLVCWWRGVGCVVGLLMDRHVVEQGCTRAWVAGCWWVRLKGGREGFYFSLSFRDLGGYLI